jgi:branched-chain amino acid transport system substrate-binding protein
MSPSTANTNHRSGTGLGMRRIVYASLVLALIVPIALWGSGTVEAPSFVRDIFEIEPKHLKIAVVLPRGSREDEFSDGVRLAIKEVNEAGGIEGIPLVIKLVPEEPFTENTELEEVVAASMEVADKVSTESNLLAVVGHMSSASALPASSIYNNRGVLFLAGHATNSSLSNHGFDYVFALQPTNADSAAMMARYAVKSGLKRFVVLYDDTDDGKETTSLFRSWVSRAGGEILFRGSLASYGRSVDKLLTFLLDNTVFKRDEIDAFFVTSSSAEDTAKFIRRARELGLTVPILGTDNMFSNRIVEYVGVEKMKDVVGVSLYNEHSKLPIALKFKKDYRDAYKQTQPDLMAAIGYDSVHLLAFAIEQAGSREPRAIADRLRIMRYEKKFVGATGPLVFDARGLVTDTDAYIVRHDGTTFKTVASYRKPLKWDKIKGDNQAGNNPMLYDTVEPLLK